MSEMALQRRVWIRSGIVEDLDSRQQALLNLVYEKIVFYYKHLHGTRPCYQYPLSLYRLRKLCNRSSQSVTLAIKYLAHTVPHNTDDKDIEPLITYDRIPSKRNASHRPYRIFLKKKPYSVFTK